VPDTPYVRNRSTGSVGGAALADLQGNGKLDIVMGAWDGRVYAWRPSGRRVPGWPVSTDTPASTHHPAGTDVFARDYKVATTPTIVDIDGDRRPDVVVALQDTAFGSSGTPVFGYVMAWTSKGKVLPHFPVTLQAVQQGYGSAQDFITEGVQTPVAYDAPSGPKLVANPGLYFAQTIDLRTGSKRQESPASVPADGPVNAASPLVHFTTSASVGKVGGRSAPLAVQSGSAATDVITAISTTPGKGIRVRSAMAAWDPETGANQAQFTQPIQGLAFLASPALADVSGDGKPDIVQSADSGALHAFDGTTGKPVAGWPKWTGGWTFFTPAVGDLTGDGSNEVAVGSREGWLHVYRSAGKATGNGEAWHWHQNDRDTGHYGDDTRPPAAVRGVRVKRHGLRVTLSFRAPGDDWNAGRVRSYQVLALRHGKVTQSRVRLARKVRRVKGKVVAAGKRQRITVELPRGFGHFAVRGVDDAGNLGPVRVR
jgi:hypothetical protein